MSDDKHQASETGQPIADDTSPLELVGDVAARWAILDVNLDLTIAILLELNTLDSACVTSQFSSHYPKLRAIVALCERKGVSKPTLKKLKTFSGRLAALTERRNRAIHDAWISTPDGDFTRFNLRDSVIDDKDPIKELTSLLNATQRSVDAFRELRRELRKEIQASSKSQP